MILLSNIRSRLVRKLAVARDNHLRKNRMQIKDPAWSTDLLPVTSDDAETVNPETLHNWGIYYVPAVRSEYFDDFPIAALISRSQP